MGSEAHLAADMAMTAADHAAQAERLLAYAGSGPDGELGSSDTPVLTAALVHAVLAIGYELGIPQGKTAAAGPPVPAQAAQPAEGTPAQ